MALRFSGKKCLILSCLLALFILTCGSMWGKLTSMWKSRDEKHEEAGHSPRNSGLGSKVLAFPSPVAKRPMCSCFSSLNMAFTKSPSPSPFGLRQFSADLLWNLQETQYADSHLPVQIPIGMLD